MWHVQAPCLKTITGQSRANSCSSRHQSTASCRPRATSTICQSQRQAPPWCKDWLHLNHWSWLSVQHGLKHWGKAMPGCCRALVVTRMFISTLMWVQSVCATFEDSGRVRKEGKLSQSECLLVSNSLKGSHGRSSFKCFRELTWDGGPSRQPMI